MTARDAGGFPISQEAYDATLRSLDRFNREIAQLRAKLHNIRNQSLEWAMTCEHNCPACDAMYEAIKGTVP